MKKDVCIYEVTNVRIAICDDDAICREAVNADLSVYKAQRRPELSVSVFDSAEHLLSGVASLGSFDLYLLDIIMPDINGIALGKQLRQLNPDAAIIYLTSSHEYAVDSYRVRAFDYLIKPVQQDRLFETLDEAFLSLSNRREKSLIIRTRENSTKASFDSIMYAKLEGKSIVYHLIGSKTIEGMSIRTSFSEAIAALLTDERFALCGSGIAVNLYYVSSIDSDTLYFRNGAKLYVGLRAGRSLRSVWMDFWMNKEGTK